MIRQLFALSAMSIKDVFHRPLLALVTITGVAIMVAAMSALLALGAGLATSGTKNIGPDMAVVVAKGATSDYLGSISRDAVNIVSEAPGVKKGDRGEHLVTPYTALIVDVVTREDQTPANVDLAGIPAESFGRIDGARLTKGRLFRPGLRELVAGRVAGERFEHLKIGERINLRGGLWTVVGEFETDGASSDGGLYGDAETILSAFDRNAYQRVIVQLTSPARFAEFKDALDKDPRLSVDVKPYRQYMQERLGQLTGILNFVGYFIGSIMGAGAFFGILNTMYAAIDARRRELATLRAVGFSNVIILGSVILDALVLVLPGAILGAAVSWILFDGRLGQVSDLAFPMTVTPQIMLFSIVWTLVIGLLGGLVPSIRAVRSSIATALRAA